ncbi:MAG TPA: hypothetical protein PKE38_04590 [Ignavibacteriaceae bacterium]|nr:hypothetical protein [Ignavibacteriaceae bacterium]
MVSKIVLVICSIALATSEACALCSLAPAAISSVLELISTAAFAAAETTFETSVSVLPSESVT